MYVCECVSDCVAPYILLGEKWNKKILFISERKWHWKRHLAQKMQRVKKA